MMDMLSGSEQSISAHQSRSIIGSSSAKGIPQRFHEESAHLLIIIVHVLKHAATLVLLSVACLRMKSRGNYLLTETLWNWR